MDTLDLLRPKLLSSSVSVGIPSLPSSPFVRPLSSPPQLHVRNDFCPTDFKALVNQSDLPFPLTSTSEILQKPAIFFPLGPVPSLQQDGSLQPITSDVLKSSELETSLGFGSGADAVVFDSFLNGFSGDEGQKAFNDPSSGSNQADDPRFSFEPPHCIAPQLIETNAYNPEQPQSNIIPESDRTQSLPLDPIGADVHRTNQEEKKPPARRSKKARTSHEAEGRLPRPPNSWILYRSEKIMEMRSLEHGLAQSVLSKQIAAQWREEPPEVKKVYERRAEIIKAEHAVKHPDYKYNPKRGKKVGQKKGSKSSLSSEDSATNVQDPSRSQDLSLQHNFVGPAPRQSTSRKRSSQKRTSSNSSKERSMAHVEDDSLRRQVEDQQSGKAFEMDNKLYQGFPGLGQLIVGPEMVSYPSLPALPEAFLNASSSIHAPPFPAPCSSGEGFLGPQNTDTSSFSSLSWDNMLSDGRGAPAPAEYPDLRHWSAFGTSYAIPVDFNSGHSRPAWPPGPLSPRSQFSHPAFEPALYGRAHQAVESNLTWQDPRLSWSNIPAPWSARQVAVSQEALDFTRSTYPSLNTDGLHEQPNQFSWPLGSN